MAKNTVTDTETKAPSRLTELEVQYDAMKVKPDAKAQKSAVTVWKNAKLKRATAEQSYESSKVDEAAAVEALILTVGKGRVKIDGTVYVPMSREKTVYLRKEGAGEVHEL